MSMKSWMLGAAIAAMTVVGVTAQAEGRTVSKGVAKSLQAAQAASKGKKWAECISQLHTAEGAAGKTDYDTFIINELLGACAAGSGDYATAASVLSAPPGKAWGPDRLGAAIDPFYESHERIRLDPAARTGRHTRTDLSQDGSAWRVCQSLIDPDDLNDWELEFRIDLASAREEGRPLLELSAIRPIGAPPA